MLFIDLNYDRPNPELGEGLLLFFCDSSKNSLHGAQEFPDYHPLIVSTILHLLKYVTSVFKEVGRTAEPK